MSKRELVVHELEDLPERDFDKLLSFVMSLKEAREETELPMLAAESSLAKDCLTPVEDAAWENL